MAKDTITGIICVSVMFIPLALMLYFHFGKEYQEKKLIKTIYSQALNGNKYAILMSKRISLIRYENRAVILEALKGNENAIEILGLNNKILY